MTSSLMSQSQWPGIQLFKWTGKYIRQMLEFNPGPGFNINIWRFYFPVHLNNFSKTMCAKVFQVCLIKYGGEQQYMWISVLIPSLSSSFMWQKEKEVMATPPSWHFACFLLQSSWFHYCQWKGGTVQSLYSEKSYFYTYFIFVTTITTAGCVKKISQV